MFWGDVESFTHIADVFSGVDIYNDYPKLKSAFKFWDDRQTIFELFYTGTTLQDDFTANFKFQIAVDRLCWLTASLQDEKLKI